jgi:hypothetical protein
VPSAAGGSLMFTPELATTALRTMREKYGEKIYGKYGFVDAFNPKIGWLDTDIIGINAGIILLSAENMRTGNVWRWFMQNPEIPLAMNRVGLNRSTRGDKNAESKSKRHHYQLRTAGFRRTAGFDSVSRDRFCLLRLSGC